MRRTAGQWATFLVRLSDALAIGSLLLVPEVRGEVVAFVALLAAYTGWAMRADRTVPERFGVLALLSAVVLAAAGVWRAGLHPLVAAANAAPATHALIWLAPANARYRGWRLGLGFVDLVLASSVTVELYLPVAFFLFAILAAVALSCNFLDAEFSEQGHVYAQDPLPRGFIVRSFGLAGLLFLSAGLIFPLLPRQNQNAGLGWGSSSRVGYNEEVRLGGSVPQAEPGGGASVLRFYTDGATEIEEWLRPGRGGYLRGATLPRFDGERWARLPVAWSIPPEGKAPSGFQLRLIHEVSEQDTVATPVGTVRLDKAVGRPREQPRGFIDGTWRDPHGQMRRREYRLTLEPGARVTDPPESPFLTQLPRAWAASRLPRVAERLFPGGRKVSARTAVARVEAYLRDQQIAASFTPAPVPEGTPPGIPVLEHFLFTAKAGHCESFAATAALLLRAAGLPTRLVAGYRISRPPNQGVLTVRSGDAHAWVEVWDAGSNEWQSYDPTPRVLWVPGFWDQVRDNYDLVAAHWYRFLTSYSESAESAWQVGDLTLSTAERWRWLSPSLDTEIDWGRWIAGLAVAIALAFGVGGALYLTRGSAQEWWLWIRQRNRLRVPAWLVRERLAMERLLRRRPERRLTPLYLQWNERYARARFGRALAGPADQVALRDLRSRLSS